MFKELELVERRRRRDARKNKLPPLQTFTFKYDDRVGACECRPNTEKIPSLEIFAGKKWVGVLVDDPGRKNVRVHKG